MSRTAALVSRALFAGFFLLTSLYCLLVHVPFTAQQLIKSEVLPILNQFARVHPYLYWLALPLAAPAAGAGRTRASAAFWGCHIAAGVLLLIHPVLVRLDSNWASLYWAMGFLVPIVWLAVLDWRAHFRKIVWQTGPAGEQRALFHAAWQSALFVTLIYAGITLLKHQSGEWNRAAECFGVGVSALSHLVVFLAFFVILNFLTVVASWFDGPPRAQFVCSHLLGAILLCLMLRSISFPALSFTGAPALAYAVCFSVALTALFSGVAVARAAALGHEVPSDVPGSIALSFWLSGKRAATPSQRIGRLIAGAVCLAAATAAVAVSVSRMDWNFLFQKIFALTIWIGAFRLFYSAASQGRAPSHVGRMLSCALLLAPTYRVYEATRNWAWKHTGDQHTLAQFLEQWSGYDVSFRLIHDELTVETRDRDLYGFLTRNTNIPRTTHVAPVPVNLVDTLEPSSGKKPNIFVIVIDSLRRDYLSPYNSQIDFTPQMGRFARESVVMENAFTHYGGTGLSEPSIWVGGMMVHKQYVTPFAPMNALQKLLEAEKYRAFISRDTILQIIVSPWPAMAELDEGRANMDYDLCSSLQEMGDRVERESSSAPIFAYTQPQNIHISVINRAGAKPISNENYGRFYAPYASRLRRMDGCFGAFIDRLKARGIYDSSIIVLTADHGDSLGEQGRWGHAYSIHPEIVRIPLIIHVPPEVRQSLYYNPKTIAFSTDITPTLYYLTGHKPADRGEIFGRPLFTEHAEEQAAQRRESYLIASSYAAVYGILSGDAKALTVFDAVNYKDYAFDLGAFFPSAENVPESVRAAVAKRLRQKVLGVNSFYHFGPTLAEAAR
jgi:hypothetical protein